MGYSNITNPTNYQLQSFGQSGVRTISTSQKYVEGEYYRVLQATQDSTISATSLVGDNLVSEPVYAGTTIYGIFSAVSVSSGELLAYLAGPTDIDDVWNYIKEYGYANSAIIEGEQCAKDAIEPLLDKYYAQASLVLVPSLYNTSIVYAERPLTTDGQLAFTRASDATRTNSAGVIELTPWNLFQQSVWTGGSLDVAPTGWIPSLSGGSFEPSTTTNGNVSYRFFATSGRGFLTQSFTVISGQQLRLSANVESVTTALPISNVLVFAGISVSGAKHYIDDVEVVGSTLISAGNRIAVTATTTAAGGILPRLGATSGTTTYDFVISRPQLVGGTDEKPYFATTNRQDVPRLDYSGGATCPRLLLEPQSTNSLTYSQDYTVGWSITAATVTSNATTAPDGTNTASKAVATATTGAHFITKSAGTLTGSFTFSIYVKAAEYSFFKISELSGSGLFNLAFDLSNGTLTGAGAGKIESVGNGWFRCSVAFSASSQTVSTGFIGTPISSTSVSYTGDGTSGVFVWGAQLEAGGAATSYIPTTSAAVTRLADAASKTGISSLIGQTEGTLFAEINVTKLVGSVSRYIFHISDGTANNRIYFAFSGSSTNVLRGRIFSGGVLQCSIDTATITATGTYKLALAYKLNDIAFYINGVQIGTDTSATIPTCSRVDVGSNYASASQFSDGISQALLFKTRLTNAQLAELTTL